MKKLTLLIAALLAFPRLAWADALEDEIVEHAIDPCYVEAAPYGVPPSYMEIIDTQTAITFIKVTLAEETEEMVRVLRSGVVDQPESQHLVFYNLAKAMCFTNVKDAMEGL